MMASRFHGQQERPGTGERVGRFRCGAGRTRYDMDAHLAEDEMAGSPWCGPTCSASRSGPSWRSRSNPGWNRPFSAILRDAARSARLLRMRPGGPACSSPHPEEPPKAASRRMAAKRRSQGLVSGQTARPGSRLGPHHRTRRLRGPHELHELGPVAERVLAARRRRNPEHIVVAELAGVPPAAQDLPEGGDADREAGVGGRVLEPRVLGCRAYGQADQLAHLGLRQLVPDLHERVLAGILIRSAALVGARGRAVAQVAHRGSAADRNDLIKRRHGLSGAHVAGIDLVVVEVVAVEEARS